MASTFLDEKISSFIEDKFPEFVKSDHPVFVEFLKEYFKFLEAAKITLTNIQDTDQILLENKLTTNYLANEFDGTRFVYEDSQYGAFLKDETVTGQTSGAVSTILAEDNAGLALYVEANRHFQVGEIITGGTSGARATIGKYQGNPVQNIQQLLEYVDVDTTINDYLDHFRETYLTAIPNTLASGVSKRKLIKSVRDLYRAKGTRKGHESFFRLMFDETPELTYPTENILKVSAGDWSSDTVLRVVATENDPNNLVGQTVTQTENVGLGHAIATAAVEQILQLQEGETTVYQLILNVASIDGTFVAGAEISGIDNTNADVSITATVQPVLVGTSVTDGAAGYTTDDTVTITSSTGSNALISIVDVGSGEIEQIVIDNPGTGYQVGDPLYFDNTNTEGSGATAIVSCIGGAIAPEVGDTAVHTVTGNTQANSTTITNITTSTLYEAKQFTVSGDISTTSNIVTNIHTLNLVIGATISGTGIPANTTISSINVAGINGTITLSAAATQTGTKIFTHLEEGTGQKITGNGIPVGTTIRTIATVGTNNNGTITISSNATATASGVTLTIPSEYGMETFDHILFDEGTEVIDAYTGSQIMLEGDTFADLGDQTNSTPGGKAHLAAHGYEGSQIDSEGGRNSNNEFIGEVVNVTVFSPGSGYELMPTITPATSRLTYDSSALTSSGTFAAGETITNDASPAVTATIVTSIRGKITISKATGSFATGQVITGNLSNAKATLTAATALGANATFLGWSSSGIGSITGVEVTNFGTGFETAPNAAVPVKMLLTRNTNVSSPPDITLATAFSAGDTIIGQSSSARGIVTAWDNTRQTLTTRTTLGTFQRAEILTRGSGVNYAILSELAQGSLSTTVGTVGTTAGAFNNDKGKISESLMKIQDSYYYQDFSYVVKVGAAIKDWRAEIKKAVHPAGFAMFGEVSITNKVATKLTVPITGITTETPTLASLFEAVLTTVVGRRLGTNSDGTTLLGSTEIKGTTDHVAGTLKRGSHLGHEPQLYSTIESITRSGTTATVETTGPHGIQAGEQVEITGVTTAGYDGVYEVSSAFTSTSFTATGNTTKDSKTVTNITTTSINEGALLGVTGSGIPADLTRFESITQAGSSNNGIITLSHAATATASGVTLTFTVVSQESFKITVSGSLTTPATVGVGKVKLVSPFDNSTRDVTLRPHTEVTVYPIYSGWWSGGQNNNYELFTLTGNTTSGSKIVTNITTTKINVGIPLGVIGAGIPTDARFNSITTEGTNNNGTITLTHAATSTTTGLILAFTGVTQVNRYGLGPRQVNAMKYMWAAPPTEYAGGISDVSENHQTLLESSTAHNDEFLILEPEVLPDVEFTVTVAGGKFVIDGTSQKALELDGARFYRFDVSNSSVNGHPFTLSEDTAEGAEYNEQIDGSIDFQIELESGSYTEYSLLTDTRWSLITEDGDDLMVQTYSRVSTYGTVGTAGAHVYLFTENLLKDMYYYCSNHSGMGSTISITPRTGGYIINEAYQLAGSSTVTNILLEDGGYILYETDTDPEEQSVMVSEESTLTYASVTEDAPSRMDGQLAYAYPNITRRESPESGTDNVDAGSAGAYDATMTYTNIKIWDHESNVHNRISDFADVRIIDMIKCGREVLELAEQTNKHEGDNDYHFTIMEDGSHIQMESGSAGIPTTSRKIWNVPPPSYIRLTTS